MRAVDVPGQPGRLRAGQLGLIVIRRVIMGDIAVTLTDLAQREVLTVSEVGGDGDWLLSRYTRGASGLEQADLLRYEKRLVDGLVGAGTPVRLSVLARGFSATLDETREELVREAVHQGWLRRLHHDQRTSQGESLALQVRNFQRDLRRLAADGDQEALAGALLPYALHFGLISDQQMPLVRFAHAWVRAFADQPGWVQPNPKRAEFDSPIAPATDPGDRMLHQMGNAAFLMGAM